MASYSVVTTALALGVDRKRLENALLRCTLPGVARGRQGKQRRLTRTAVLALAILFRLQDHLGVPLPVAVALLPALLAGPVAAGPFRVVLDVTALERDVAAGIAAAVEIAPRPKRGRPAKGHRKEGSPHADGASRV